MYLKRLILLITTILKMANTQNVYKVALYGKTGAGKSTLCNLLLGREEFKVGHDLYSETSEIQKTVVDRQGFPKILLADTPGFGENRKGEEGVT